MMANRIDSIKHKEEKRLLIPSTEEAGLELANDAVENGKSQLEIPLNPVVTRGHDPELFWMNKYGNDDRQNLLKVDIRSLYRHEHITPELIIKNLYRLKHSVNEEESLFSINEMFGNMLDRDELDKISSYYRHFDGWTNRLIQGDSLLVMTSLLEREGMAGQVQTIYIDPPYGVKYNSNWQVKLNSKDVKDGSDESLAGEPEVIKAYRDTWELGIHSYLSYLRDRLLVAKNLLKESGSCFVQISDENIHLVRNLLDEVFGSENFVSIIPFRKTVGATSELLPVVNDYIIWYARKKDLIKFRSLYRRKNIGERDVKFKWYEKGKNLVKISDLGEDVQLNPDNIVALDDLTSQDPSPTGGFGIDFQGNTYYPPQNRHWRTTKDGIERLLNLDRIVNSGERLLFKRFLSDRHLSEETNFWFDTVNSFEVKDYVVQTNQLVIHRCLIMSSDPGDLILDPTCGGGTTAYVAENLGRRWITIDTSRIALNITKQRLLTANFPYYKLYDSISRDIRQGFVYKKFPRITLKSLANNEPPETEILYDQPEIDKNLMRVTGPFTVETLQNFEPLSPDDFAKEKKAGDSSTFENVIKDHLLSAGIKNGRKDEHAKFSRVELLAGEYINAEGFYNTGTGERKAYFYIGPKFGTVSKMAVNNAIKECRSLGDADWLVILGFSFESEIANTQQTMSMGTFEVTKVRMNDDLLQDGLKKKPAKSAASFITIGEPDILVEEENGFATVEILGVDIYDPISDKVNPRDLHDIAYWMVDDDYDSSNFVVKQIFFCGGNKDEFNKWKKGLSNLAKEGTRKKVEHTLRIEIDEEAFDRLYGFRSHPIKIKENNHKIAVRVISQFGEETMKVYKVR
ncbi:MAG: site-specific DNA-methyltransferase [Bacteroidetes bacterium]|nr:site-specific DNA-methyltransferase [Bacteroidota bacterium]